MREKHLSAIDLNLLPALEALLLRRHVTLAAGDVGLSQPAMSRALGRLRLLLDDALLVRGASGFMLTPRAHDILPELQRLLAGTSALLKPKAFDVAALKRTLFIAASDAHAVLLMPEVIAKVRREAPGVVLVIEPYSRDILRRFESSELDLAFAEATTPLPPGAMITQVGFDSLALVMRRDHPAAREPWSLADYARYDHAVVSIFGDQTSEIDTRLAQAGIARRIGFASPYFLAALAAVAASDMITTLSRALAERFAPDLGLLVRTPPFSDASLAVTLVRTATRADDPVLNWLCGLVSDAAQHPAQTRFMLPVSRTAP